MVNVICRQNCPVPFCEPVCPLGAIKLRSQTVYIDTDKCDGCGLCRGACITWSLDKALAEKTRDWLSGKS